MKIKKKILHVLDKTIFRFFNDEVYLKIKYKMEMGQELNLENPQTFNEKLQWLKLNDRKDIYTTMVDKYEAKQYVANIIGEEYIIKTLGIYDKFEEINFDELPKQFVIKCTHDSGSSIVCKNKDEFDIQNAKRKINRHLKKNFYHQFREWPYKNVKPRIIVEEYMEDEKYKDIPDYKIYCFNGECEYVMVCVDRMIGQKKFIYYDKNWEIQKELSNDGMKYGDNIDIPKPKNLDKMFECASILSKNNAFLRVDFYEVNGKMYFGELTFYPSAGFDNKRTTKMASYLNEKLKI